MKEEPSGATRELPLVAFIGESQVGKSSLVNALAGVSLLPTTGTGAPRSQAVCEWFVPAALAGDARWRVSAAWQSREAIARAVAAGDAHAHLLCEGLSRGKEVALVGALRALQVELRSADLATWAAGRDVSWLPLDAAVVTAQARRQVEILSAGWPAALAACVRICSEPPPTVCLVDLPGLGHDDVGGLASAAWLEAHAPRVAAIVCVVGKRTPELLEGVLHKHWPVDELRQRLHVVATFADQLVEDAENENERRRAADARRHRAAEHLRLLMRSGASGGDLLPRTFCLDPRPTSRFWRKVEFDGEIERLRTALAAVRAPAPRPALAVATAPCNATRSTHPAAPSQASTIRRPVPDTMALLCDEGIEQWMTRLVLPLLRKGRWATELLRSGRRRMHLQAGDRDGHEVTLITVYGTGEAYVVASTKKIRVEPPSSERAGRELHGQLLGAARELGVAAPESISMYSRSAR